MSRTRWDQTAADVNARYFASSPCGLVACIPSLPSSLPRASALIWLHASFAPVCISIKACHARREALLDLIVHVSPHPPTRVSVSDRQHNMIRFHLLKVSFFLFFLKSRRAWSGFFFFEQPESPLVIDQPPPNSPDQMWRRWLHRAMLWSFASPGFSDLPREFGFLVRRLQRRTPPSKLGGAPVSGGTPAGMNVDAQRGHLSSRREIGP